ncbi:MAG: hypothetical protein ABFC34_03300 [Methanobacterium sp.]
MNKNDFPLLKLKYESVLPHATEISLNGVPVPRVRGVKFISHVENDVNLVFLELLARVDIESPANFEKEMITVIDGEKYKLVKMEDDNSD